jgi:pimeloyl-ACP methyl ester carboxylesterase
VNKLKWVLVAVAIVLVVSAGGFVVWASDASQPMPEALAALQSDAQVAVETGRWIVFRPVITAPTTGLIFYPGGKVDARAYAPAAHAIAARGYLVVITPMPLNLAVLGVDKAADVIKAFPSIKHWAIGGHSLGGSMAASFARKHPDVIQGIVFWASYPADSDNLSATNLAVASIYASNDGLATGDKIDRSRPLLPSNTTWVKIEGGNHAQFGWYGVQAGDGQATINRQVQQDQIMRATLEFLRIDSR